MKKAEEVWLAKIEREYNASRADRDTTTEQEKWNRGNKNREDVDVDDDDDDYGENVDGSDKANDGDEDEDEDGVAIKDPYELSEESDDEEEMAELRRKVLASKPFANPQYDEPKAPPERIPRTEPPPPEDSDAESGSDLGGDEEFDSIINATPVTDRTGITAKQRLRSHDAGSATFSRTVLDAPKKR